MDRSARAILSSIGIVCMVVVSGCVSTPNPKDNPKGLVEKMVARVGGVERLYSLKDVEYTYAYRDSAQGTNMVSLERYVFEEERSWARYKSIDQSFVPHADGDLIQGYDGENSWMTIAGKPVEEPQLLKMSDFLRKTNYYWFTMMFKLVDPGINYEYQGVKSPDGVEYDMVKVTFGEGVGDVQDTYVLYLNRETGLVDQFLFTVMDFGMAEPFLMKVEYEEVEGLKLPTKRTYAKVNWDGEPQDDNWASEISTNIKFNNGFDKTLFEKPAEPEQTSKM